MVDKRVADPVSRASDEDEIRRLLEEVEVLKARLCRAEAALWNCEAALMGRLVPAELPGPLDNPADGVMEMPVSGEVDLASHWERLLRGIRELMRSNIELEQFAFRIAHDLRSPLLSICGCATVLIEEAGDRLTPSDRELIGYLEESAAQLKRLVDSLLNYSRVGHGQLHRTQCDMEAILNAVLSNLRSAIEAAGARITWVQLPMIWADEALMGELLQNLIENALKYRRDLPPEIAVSAREEPDAWIFAVRDNGIGIPPEYHEQIFQIFARLHADERKYPGHGVGLAACKRILEKHAGRIWVESAPGSGSVFYFSLPRPPQPAS